MLGEPSEARDADWCELRAQVADVIARRDPDPGRRAQAAAVAYDLRRIAHDLRVLDQIEELIDNPDLELTAFEDGRVFVVVAARSSDGHSADSPVAGPFP